jgi:ATP-dependent Na+ efflux pump
MEKMKMNKIWTVAKFEVIRQLKKPSFWIALFLLPVVIIGFIGLSSLSNSSFGNDISKNNKTANENTFGITDKAGVINEASLTEKVSKIETKEEGIEKVKNGEIKEYYYIPEDFFESKKVEGYNVSTDGGSLFVQSVGNITSLLTASAMMRVSPIDASILTNQIKVENTTFDENGEKANLLGKAIIPIAVLAIYYILVCVFGNRMLLAVVEEKENRISEMILTAVSAKELIIGKIIALIVLGFLQMAVFIVPVIIFVLINHDNPMVSNVVGMVEFEPISFIMNIALLIFSYFLFAGFSVLVGSMMPTARDASQYISIVIIGSMLPFFFMNTVISSNVNIMTYALSYFPLSAPIAMMLRNAFGLLPWYEFMIGIIEIGAFSAITIYLATKSFQKNAINFSLPKLRLKRRK